MRAALPAVLLLSGLLAACVTTPEGAPATGASAAADLDESGRGESRDAEVAALPPLPRLDLAEIMTWPRDRLLGSLGTPVFRRKDKGAEILRFRGEDCLLDVYMYPDGPGGALRIAHLEARGPGGQAADKAACLNRTPRGRTG